MFGHRLGTLRCSRAELSCAKLVADSSWARSQVVQMAQFASQVHFRSKSQPKMSATSKPQTSPIRNAPTAADIVQHALIQHALCSIAMYHIAHGFVAVGNTPHP